ncbi:UDP-glucose--hexose-1-phosphate uridylyltransferase [Edaphobacter dinghuensis]|uniref:Galactose-1-phosphate uridylyltransferase n=1 Tax=Edaphobacter dinghuensis TaxID=1560005 RepID=A0A917HP26_9BACT|nr:UDP-glucose--hexose-1-phosphate uridylyltransferase [Edaphobacter dinghuensis]GGG84817.1 galactose-1-phosphate uridylyltransferase [Edaphobacter dinghuensis]
MNPLAQKNPHRRFNPLKQEWVLVSPNRTQRPWQGQMEKPVVAAALQYDPDCYLCPGNVRAGGARTDKYTSTYVFENDYAALKLDAPRFSSDEEGKGILVAEGESGVCRVICFSPRHDLTLAKMSVPEIRKVVDVWAEQYRELGSRDDISYVQVFENRGAMMGASNPHPHGQIWASRSIPNEVVLELRGQGEYLREHGCCLLCAYRELELRLGERVIAKNDSFVAVVPYWAVWPFEVMILPLRHIADVEAMTDAERDDFAAILQSVTSTYDRVFDTPFPYSMGLHPRPSDGEEHPEWHFHAHFYPPLLRSATIRKFMVGYELLGSPQRDITAESAAEVLRQAAARAV